MTRTPDAGLRLTIPQVLDDAVARFGPREALVDDDRRWTFAELGEDVARAARALVGSGVEVGDRVAVWAPNVAEWVIAALATYTAGGVLVPLNTRFKGPEAEYVLQTSGARMLLTVDGFLGNDYVGMLRSGAAIAGLEEVVLLRGDREATTPWSAFLERAASVEPAEVASRRDAVSPRDVSDLIFTSGTTGAPKGAMLEHGPSIWAYRTWNGVIGLREQDRYLILNPFFHTFGLKAGILACILSGATIVPHTVFEVPVVLRRVEEERISMLPGPPTVFQTMLDHPDLHRFDVSSLRLTVTGAATVPVEMVRRMRSELPFETIITGYGLTETIGITSCCRPDDDAVTVATTAGRPIPGVEVAIVDDSGRRLGVEEPGEVLTRGPNMMRGYFENPEATAEALDGDGWLHTGDIGVVDEMGNVRITDRKKDMFIVGGFNAYPAEIENVLVRHPAVGQCAVIGVPDERLGEVGMAFVIPRGDADVDVVELEEWCRTQLANFKVPRRIVVVDAFPLNATGKVLKYELRAAAGRLDEDKEPA
jgi:acyl-CoA synthetase (AMP-forming)/AMP-acid ligase II